MLGMLRTDLNLRRGSKAIRSVPSNQIATEPAIAEVPAGIMRGTSFPIAATLEKLYIRAIWFEQFKPVGGGLAVTLF